MQDRRPKEYKCDECNSRFVTPLPSGNRFACPSCGNPDFKEVIRQPAKVPPADQQDSGWKYTGITQNGLYLYKDAKGREKWLQHGTESLISPATKPDPAVQKEYEAQMTKVQSHQTAKKNQAEYRKLRYKLMKEGKWTGSMKESKVDEQADKLHGSDSDKKTQPTNV